MSNHAVVIQKPGEADIREVSIPELRDDYINVKVHAVALNPTDWKHIDLDFLAVPGARVGCDYAGVVEAVGKKVTKDLKKGDRVCGFIHGANASHHEDGAFQEHCTAKGDIQIKVPDNLSFEEAATLGVGITTVGQSLYQSLQLPLPDETEAVKNSSGTPILIYGGSTATGSLAVQFAKLSGFSVIATSSPHNFALLKSRGADATFDYNSPTCSEDIREYSKNKLAHVLDCIATGDSIKICVSSMGSEGGIYSTLLPVGDKLVHDINDKVKNGCTLGYTVVGEAFDFGSVEVQVPAKPQDVEFGKGPAQVPAKPQDVEFGKGPAQVPAKPQDFEFGKIFWELTRGLIAEGRLEVHPCSVNEAGKGLQGVLKGLDLMRQGKVSGKKLVYTL